MSRSVEASPLKGSAWAGCAETSSCRWSVQRAPSHQRSPERSGSEYQPAGGSCGGGVELETGVHRNYIGGIERGERSPTVAVIVRLADALGASLTDPFAEAERIDS